MDSQRRGFFLRKSLMQSGEGATGWYEPASGARTVNLGSDHASPVARMVSLHETFHSMLNASTTFGGAMMLAGALQQAGEEGMEALIERMIGACLEAHETYATMSGIYVAAYASYDSSLLEDYPDYRQYFDRMAHVLDLDGSPFLSSLCIAAAARVAMQTDILDRWNSMPCSDWHSATWDEPNAPDARFALAVSEASIAAALQALRISLANAPPKIQLLARAGLSEDERIRAFAEAPLPEQEALQAAAFGAIAAMCFTDDERRPRWLAQRAACELAIAKARAYAGDRLRTVLVPSRDLEGDFDATLVNARHERLSVWPGKLLAILHRFGERPDVGVSDFVLDTTGFRPHIQLIGAPCDKLAALYEFKDPLPDGPPRRAIAALRRFVETPSLPVRGFVHMLELRSPEELPEVKGEERAPLLFALICASALGDAAWADSWMDALMRRRASTAILIDADPFRLIPSMSSISALNLIRTRLDPGDLDLPANIHVIAFAYADLPNFILFSPCSESSAMSLAMMMERNGYNVQIGGSLTDEQLELLQTAMSHVLIEEPQFGFSEWWRQDVKQ